jgi:hypothetical protein
MARLTKEARVLLGDDQLLKAESLQVEINSINNNTVEISIYVNNKWGKFQLYPNIDTYSTLISKGSSIFLMTGKDFKLKTRIKIS